MFRRQVTVFWLSQIYHSVNIYTGESGHVTQERVTVIGRLYNPST